MLLRKFSVSYRITSQVVELLSQFCLCVTFCLRYTRVSFTCSFVVVVLVFRFP